MTHVTVVGSGASAVHFALSLLERGHRVTMIDGGLRGRPFPLPEAGFAELKERLDDPVGYLLGEDFDGVVLPEPGEEYYGIPPEKAYVFRQPRGFRPRSSGFAPLFSFAEGGLAEAWTAGCYPLNAAETVDFPFDHDDLLRAYGTVAARIGVTGADDDLARFMPLHDALDEPLRLDAHSDLLMRRYARKRHALGERLGCWMGRTRVAVASRDIGGRKKCDYLGRCLWGCPLGSLYVPSHTLDACRRHERFEYVPGMRVTHLTPGPDGAVSEAVATTLDGSEQRRFPVQTLALAAGALNTSAIVLETRRRAGEADPSLEGLMDNRQVLVPFVTPAMIGRRFEDRSYQYHQIGMGIEAEDPREYVHGQVTTLKTAMLHPVVQGLPFDLGTSTRVGRAMHAALGVVNVNFHDDRRPDNRVRLEADPEGGHALAIEYAPPAGEADRMRRGLGIVRKALRKLGAFPVPGMAHVRPMGSSVHYAGTLPMSRDGGAWTTEPDGRSRDFSNVWVVDGATFPFLPAKNLTFTLMANAVRIAEAAF